MFTEVRFSNFKGFAGDHSVNMRSINLIYGQNSAGKTALIETLLLMNQSIRRPSASGEMQTEPLAFSGVMTDLGNFKSAINGHNLSKMMKLGISYNHNDDEAGFHEFNSIIKWDHSTNTQVLEESIYSLSNLVENTVKFRRTGRNSESSLQPVIDEGFRNVANLVSNSFKKRFATQENKPFEHDIISILSNGTYENWSFLPGLAAPERSDDEDSKTSIKAFSEYWCLFDWRSMLSDRFHETREKLDSIRYIGPLRNSPSRFEPLKEIHRNYVGRNGVATASVLYRNPKALVTVNDYLEILEIPYEVSVKRIDSESSGSIGELVSIQLIDKRTNVILTLEDVGFGISQILPILVQIALNNKETIIIEQPELHIHPAMQAKFADILIEGIENGCQFIIETHSEHLVLRLQRRVRKGQLDKNRLNIIYVEANNSTGSELIELNLDENGEFESPWPNGFFPERLDEILGD